MKQWTASNHRLEPSRFPNLVTNWRGEFWMLKRVRHLHEDMEQTLELQRWLAQRATFFEKEKKEVESVLQRRVLEFKTERSALQNRIQNMNEDLREKAELKLRRKSISFRRALGVVGEPSTGRGARAWFCDVWTCDRLDRT